MKRKKISSKHSKRLFKVGARLTDTKNISPRPMRGGIRL